MKKIISIVCIVALLVTSLGTTLFSAVADEVVDTAFTTEVTTVGVESVESENTPYSKLYSLSGGTWFNTVETPMDNVAGALFYLEGNGEDALSFKTYFSEAGEGKAYYYQVYNGTFYAFDADKNFWSTATVSATVTTLSADFKGYIMVPVRSFGAANGSGDKISAEDSIIRYYLETSAAVVSDPVFVYGDNQTTMPTFKSIVLGGTTYSMATPDTNPVDDNDTVIMPSFVDVNGKDFYPEGTSKVTLPASVATSGVTVAENTTGLPLGALFNIPDAQSSRLYVDPVRGAGTTGLMMYVEAPVTTDGSDYKFYAYYGIIDSETGKKGCYMSNAHHTFAQYAAKGSSYWKTQGTDLGDYSVWLPSGFKGYLYIPFNTLSNVSGDGVGSYTENDIITEVWFLNTDRANVENDQYLKVSAPILTKGTFAERTRPINSLVWHGETYLLDGSGLVEEDDDYVKPPLSAGSTLYQGLTTTFVTSLSHRFNTATPTAKATEFPKDLNPLSGFPSYSFKNVTATLNSDYYFNKYSDKVAEYIYTAGSQFDGFLLYVDVSSNTSTTTPAHLDMNIAANVDGSGWSCPINGNKAAAYNSNPAVYLLWDDGVEGTRWTERKLLTTAAGEADNLYGTSYTTPQGVILPAGFKGYVYVPHDAFTYNHQGNASIKQLLVSLSSGLSNTSMEYYMSGVVAFRKGYGFDPAVKTDRVFIEEANLYYNLDTNEVVTAGFESYNKPATYKGINPNVAVDSSLIPHVDALAVTNKNNIGTGTYVWHPYVKETSNYNYHSSLRGGILVGNSTKYTDANAKISTVFTNDVIKNHPAIKVDAVNDLSGSLVQFLYNDKDSTDYKIRIVEDAGFMVYFVNDSETATELTIYPIQTYNESGTVISTNAFKYSRGNSRVLEKGADSWVPVTGRTTADSNIILRAGFEGYVFFDFASFANFTTVKDLVNNIALNFQITNVTIAADDSLTFSLPMYVTNFADDYNDTAFIVNGAEYAQDLLTKEFVVPHDNNGDMKLDVLDLVYNKANDLSNTHFRKNYFGFRDYVKSSSSDEDFTEPSTPSDDYIQPSDNVTFPEGAKALFAGDSFCFAEYDTPKGYGWPGRINDNYGLSSLNIGSNGRPLAIVEGRKTIEAEFDNVNLSDYNSEDSYIIIQGGVNDIWMDHLNHADIPLGNITPKGTTDFDLYTTAGALESLFAKVKSEAPNAKVGFIISFNVSNYIGNMEPFVNLAKEICDKWEVPYLDFYNHPTFNAELNANIGTYLYPSDPHPVKACYDSMSRYIAAWMGQL